MKALAWFFMVLGALELISIGVEELSGIAYLPGYRAPGEYVRKEDRPDRFHDAISYGALYSFLFLALGFSMWEAARRSEKSDPSSPDYAGSKALDDWSKALDEEAERRGLKKPRQDTGKPEK